MGYQILNKGYQMDYIGHHVWGMGFGMWFIFIVFILFILYFLKEANTKCQDKHSNAQDILDRRYANGEIDTEEYKERSSALKKNN